MKNWKWSDLWTDATGKLDEKRIIGMALIFFGVGYLIFSGKLDHFAAIEGFGIGLLGGAVAADQGK
jgi:drug/metabolite transporter (DMT)-like permease